MSEVKCSAKAKRKKRQQKRRRKRMIIRMMIVIVMSIFLFSGAINKAYALQINKDKISFNGENTEENTKDGDKEKIKKVVDESSNDENNNVVNENNTSYSNNTSEKGKKYIYDAVEVAEKLKKGDYKNDGKKIVFLTFDDGASNTVTPKILKILKDNDVKATFFVMGKIIEDGGETARDLIKQEYEEGNAICNHSFSHDYNILYPGRSLDLDAFKKDYAKNDRILKDILGEDFSTRVIRCPGGYMSWHNMDKLDEYLKDNNMAAIDWSALSKDAEGKAKNADELIKCAIETSKGQEMVVLLMHDTYGKEETAKSLQGIIDYFKEEGYEFRTLG